MSWDETGFLWNKIKENKSVIDTIKTNLNTAISRLGATNNTGGSTTAGTAMAKLNALLTLITSTRMGYIDRLANGTYGLEAIKNAINNSTTARRNKTQYLYKSGQGNNTTTTTLIELSNVIIEALFMFVGNGNYGCLDVYINDKLVINSFAKDTPYFYNFKPDLSTYESVISWYGQSISAPSSVTTLMSNSQSHAAWMPTPIVVDKIKIVVRGTGSGLQYGYAGITYRQN